jgi:DNA polymerase
MGMKQGTRQWARLNTHGGKLTENIVQAIARDALAVGLKRAMDAGWPLVGHVHDELIALIQKMSNMFTGEGLRALMIDAIMGLEGLPLNASASTVQFYRKD